jgi:hypothetical protein
LDLHLRLRCLQFGAHAQPGRRSSRAVSRRRGVPGRAGSEAPGILQSRKLDRQTP